MSASAKMTAIPLPVVPAARSTIAPPKGPRLNLPPPFKPQAESATREVCDFAVSARSIMLTMFQELRDACHVEPFALLPRMFIPIPSAIYRPPTMHYGWSAPRETLLAYAKEHGLILMMGRRRRPLADESDGESSDDDASDSSTDDGTEDTGSGDDDSSSKGGDESDGSGTVVVERTCRPLPPLFPNPRGMNIDEPASMVAALKHVSTQLSKDGLQVATMALHSTLQHDEDELRIISVYTNYHLHRKDLPSPEDIRKLGEAVGITAPPKWYIDRDKYEWYLIRDPYGR
ncbi:uncharacterized protein B0H18DRAFT_65162 [Fomitopsis serialis]|uniref:uncharacterized protein n=1 Tax=Fomitopsis serialis TaxID=139415 RepID=UPI0020075E7B|nr:uncharacterized protein B0H18DRAFT_65162 [Neoantrodia serialis]KAH9916468.1 hypothetical protein B0H18DRAFT_65162 [Neoantrodia serialis]